MKVSGDPLQYCKSVPKNIRAVLLYGPNTALIKEAANEAWKSFLPAEQNEFSVVTLTPEQLKQNPAALTDELASYGFFASKKLIHLKNAEDNLVKFLQPALDAPDAGHFIIIEAEELGPKSALRSWAEKAGDVAAIACYMLEGANLQRFIAGQFTAQNARINNDAAMLLADRLGNDLTPLKNIVSQLVSYVGGHNPQVTTDHIQELLVDQAEQEMDTLVQSVATANLPQLDRALQTLDASGTTMVAILRNLQAYFYKLRSMQVALKNGEDVDALMKRQRIFFKLIPSVKKQLREWSMQRIDNALAEFTALEAACKKTGTPELLLVHQRLMRVSLK